MSSRKHNGGFISEHYQTNKDRIKKLKKLKISGFKFSFIYRIIIAPILCKIFGHKWSEYMGIYTGTPTIHKYIRFCTRCLVDNWYLTKKPRKEWIKSWPAEAELNYAKNLGKQVAKGNILFCPLCKEKLTTEFLQHDQDLLSVGDYENELFCPHCDTYIDLIVHFSEANKKWAEHILCTKKQREG